MSKKVEIPASEWGPGSRIDLANNRLIGASGQIYNNVTVKREDVMRLWPAASSLKLYILEGKTPVPCSDPLVWEREVFKADRTVKKTTVGDMYISTIFLGVCNSVIPGAAPLLFETMIFNVPGDDEYQRRYSTWEEAEAGHEKAVEIARGRLS